MFFNEQHGDRSFAHSALVAAGIFLSRIAGLIRDRVFAHYFGNSDAADAFRAAFRIPNLLQNLFGEGVLSASFIPVYARLAAHNRHDEAVNIAHSIAGILSLVISFVVCAGIILSPFLVDIIAPGFDGAKRELTITIVKILFPGAGILVFSAWCLGILNSHGRFFLSYSAPVIWNVAIILTLVLLGDSSSQNDLALYTALGSVAGSLLQLLIQLPTVITIIKTFRLSLSVKAEETKTIIKNFVPVFFGRGVVQISAFVDTMLASLLPTGAVAALSYAQSLYMLPISLFGMAVSAAELPAMSAEMGDKDEIAKKIRERIHNAIQRISFYIVPSTVALLFLGDVIVAAVYQTGKFGAQDTFYVWMITAGSTVGLLAVTQSRLFSSAFYAMQDTRTPLKFAIMRVLMAGVGGYFASQYLPPLLGIDALYGTVGIAMASGVSGWVEYKLLQRAMAKHIGKVAVPILYSAKVWVSAIAAAVIALSAKTVIHYHHIILAAIVLSVYGIVYLALTVMFNIDEGKKLLAVLGYKKK